MKCEEERPEQDKVTSARGRGQGFAWLPLGVDSKGAQDHTINLRNRSLLSIFRSRHSKLFHHTAQKHEVLKSSKGLSAIHRWVPKMLKGQLRV